MRLDEFGVLDDGARVDNGGEGLGGEVSSIKKQDRVRVRGLYSILKNEPTHVCFRCKVASVFLTWLYCEYLKRISLSILADSYSRISIVTMPHTVMVSDQPSATNQSTPTTTYPPDT